MAVSVFRILFACLCVGLILYGFLDVQSNYEENACEMTYMFQQPEYLSVPLKKKVRTRFPRYGLYVYGEGEYAQYLRDHMTNLQGTPVLFLPGNAGSYKQVRSLGSVALRRVEEKKPPFHFNYFSVDFNEELTGAYGGTLQEQTEFVHECIKTILSLYKKAPKPPNSVVLVGHSMGGIIARALFTLPDFDSKIVNTIITQATPHQAPVVAVDRSLTLFVHNVNNHWRRGGNVDHVLVVSTGGGLRDVLVRNGLTSLQGIVEESRAVYTSTMSIPNAWVSTDHLCAVWCKQVVMATVRATFDMMDHDTQQVSEDVNYRAGVFRYHLISHTGGSTYSRSHQEEITLDTNGQWIPQKNKLWEFVQKHGAKPTYLVVPLDQKDVDHFVSISDVMTKDWICGCKMKPGKDKCTKCKNLSENGHLIPPKNSYRKVAHLKLADLGDMTHIILIIPPTREKVEVMGDIYDQSKRHLSYRMPGFLDILMSYPESVSKSASKLMLFNDTLFYSLHLQGIDNVLKTFKVSLQARRCESSGHDMHSGSMMVFHVPWSNEDKYSFSSLDQIGNLSIKLQSGIPSIEDYGDIELRVYIDPSCSYELNFVVTPSDTLGQIVRFYGPLLPGFIVSVLFLALVQQIYILHKDKACPSVLDAIAANGQPFKLVPFCLLLRFVLSLELVLKYTRQLGLPDNDSVFLDDLGLNMRPLPMVLYLLSLGLTNFYCFFLHVAFSVVDFCIGPILNKFLVFIGELWHKVEQVLLVTAFLLSLVVCGTVGMIICYALLVIKLISLKHASRMSSRCKSQFNFQCTLMLLIMLLVTLNAPALLMIPKTIKYSFMLPGDSTRVIGVLTVLSVSAIFYCKDALTLGVMTKGVYFSIYGFAVFLVLYGVVSLYRISYVIVSTLLIMAFSLGWGKYKINH